MSIRSICLIELFRSFMSSLIFCLFAICITNRGLLKSPSFVLSIFPFRSIIFLLHVFWSSIIRCLHIGLSLFWTIWLLYCCIICLFIPGDTYIWKFIFIYINIASPYFFWFVLMWYICASLLLLIYIFIYIVVFYRKHMVGYCVFVCLFVCFCFVFK